MNDHLGHGDAQDISAGKDLRLPWAYLPSRRVWILWLIFAIAILIVRNLQIDLAVINIITLVLVLLCLVLFLAWWCFRSPFPAAVRWLLPVILLVTSSVIAVRYRMYKTSGSLVPQFIRRGAATPDELLDPTPRVESPSDVDLWTTTPYDFPRFLGPQANSAVMGIRLRRDWDQYPPRLLWKRDVGAGWSGFSVVNGFALTLEQRGTAELVTCYEVLTGDPCWSHSLETRHETILGFVGPRSTPTIIGGRVYALGSTGVLRCLDGKDGTEVWVRDLLADYGMSQEDGEKAVAWGRASSPLVIENRVVIPLGGPRGGKCITLLALDTDTGATIWEAGNYQAAYASPTVLELAGRPQIVSVNEDFVSSHDIETGKVLWEHPWEGRSDFNANASQPHAVGPRRVFLSKGYSKGAEVIELTPNADAPWNVELVWQERVMKTKFSNVAIRNGMAYGLDDGILSCVDVATGDKMWKKGRYRYGQILLVDDLLLVMSENGELALVEAAPERFREVGRFPALEGQTWNTLCLYGTYLLVRNAEQAACYELAIVDEAD